MSLHHSYLAGLAAAGRARRNAARTQASQSPTLFGYNAAGVGPGGRTTGPSLGGAVAQAQARAAAQARAVAAMPLTGMGGLGASPAAAGATAANATAAPFGNRYGRPPSHGSNPFLRGITGFADGAGGGYADPGARFEGAVGQAGNAFLAILKGASPTAPYDQVLRHSAREAAKAKAEIGATQALFDAYMPAPRHDAARAAAELAAGLGVPLRAAGPASTGSGYPPRRFGMAQNPYLTARLSAGSDTGRYGASNPFGPGYTALMAPPHMVREGYSRPRPQLAFPTPSGRIAPDVGGGRWYNASRDGGARLHNGIDFEATPGDPVVSTVDGVVTMVGQPYPEPINAGEPTYRYVEVTTPDGFPTRLLYVDPSVKLGDRVRAGKTRIGVAQDITLRYPDAPGHVHFEMRNSGKPLPTMDQVMGRTYEQSKIDYHKMSPRVDPTNLFSWPWPFEVRRPPR